MHAMRVSKCAGRLVKGFIAFCCASVGSTFGACVASFKTLVASSCLSGTGQISALDTSSYSAITLIGRMHSRRSRP
eukprot:scaffold133419_cov22-Prasinocladus_malaysianus.AAC.2